MPRPPANAARSHILFADLSGFTRLSAQLDPEEVHALLQRYFGEVDGLIARHQGTVDKHIGDCVMGVFGAPIAHPDDAERAVRCALGAGAGGVRAVHGTAALVQVDSAASELGSREAGLQAPRYLLEAMIRARDPEWIEHHAASLEAVREEEGGVPWATLHALRGRAFAARIRRDPGAPELLTDASARLRAGGLLDAATTLEEDG